VGVGTVAVPGVTIGRWDEDAAVTDGTVAVPAVTPAGVACILRDAQARLPAPQRVRLMRRNVGKPSTPCDGSDRHVLGEVESMSQAGRPRQVRAADP
jgi:hypothetical protein